MNDYETKLIKLAAEICWMHGSIAGNRSCQDWSGSDENIDALTVEEKQRLVKQYEEYNSDGEDYDPDDLAFYDEMCVSFYVAYALDLLAKEAQDN